MFRRLGFLPAKNKIDQNKCNYTQSQRSSSFIDKFINLIQIHSFFLSRAIEKYNNIIKLKILQVNSGIELVSGIVKKTAAAIFVQNPAYILKADLENITLIKTYYNKIRFSQQGFIRLTKKSLIMSLIVWLVVISSGIYLLFFRAKEVKAAWADDNWGYRTSYSINNTGAADSNKKIKFDIDTATLTTDKLQADVSGGTGSNVSVQDFGY